MHLGKSDIILKGNNLSTFDYFNRYKFLESLLNIKREEREGKENISKFDENAAIFVITKNHPERIKRTLPYLLESSIDIIIIDDSTSLSTKKLLSRFKNKNVIYHGAKEQFQIINKIPHRISLTPFIALLGSPNWTLGFIRNYAVILAILMGYEKILLIDDDIITESFHVIKVFHMLNRYNVVGSKIIGMPDDSIVGHLYRQLTCFQYNFISGSFVSFNIKSLSNFFLNFYNEDMILFVLQTLTDKLISYGEVIQLPYDIMKSSFEKCIFQEKGEILLDGLIIAKMMDDMSLLKKIRFWKKVISIRINDLKYLYSIVKSKNISKYKKLLKLLIEYDKELSANFFSECFRKYFSLTRKWSKILKELKQLKNVGGKLWIK